MMAEDKNMPFEKLCGQENWAIWSDAMQTYLEAINCWKILKGQEERPVVPELAGDPTAAQRKEHDQMKDKQQNWDIRAARAKHEINRMVSSDLLYLVADPTLQTAGERWGKLEEQFQKDTMANQLQVITRLIELRMADGQSIDEYYKQYLGICNRLTALKCEVSKQVRTAVLLRGLPDTFNTIRAAYLAKGTFEISELMESLRSEEVRCQSGQEPAHVMKMSRTDTRKKKETKFQPKVRGPPGSCYECGKPGHKARDCRNKQDGGRRKQLAKATLQESDDETSDADETRGHGKKHKDGRLMLLLDGEKTKPTEENCNQTTVTQRRQRLFVDSGASSHMMYDQSLFSQYCKLTQKVPVQLGNGSIVYAVGIGTVNVNTTYSGKECAFSLQNVYHVPDLTNNFLSVSAMARVGNVCAVFDDCGVQIQDKKSCQILGYGNLIGNIYLLSCNSVLKLNMSQSESTHTRKGSTNTLKLWHRRLGHCGVDRIKSAVKKSLVTGMEEINGELDHCKGCIKGKMVKAPFPEKDAISSQNVLDLVHTDVCGPFSTKSAGGAKYFVTFIDDFSRMRALFPLASKNGVFGALREFEAMVTTQTGRKIKAIRSDCGGEYMDHRVQNWMKQKGIRHETTAPYSPQQNGVAERTNRILCESAVSMMEEAGVDRSFWAEAVSTACYLSNRLPTKAMKVTPYERWYGKKPSLKHLKVWGCVGYALKTSPEKLTSKVRKLRFVGYDLYNKGAYRLWDDAKKKLYIRRDVKFLEDEFDVTEKPGRREITKNIIETDLPKVPDQEEQGCENQQWVPETEADENQGAQRTQRNTKQPERYGEWATEEDMEDLDWLRNSHLEVLFNMINECEPKTMQEAMDSSESSYWKEAVKDELDSLAQMETWTLVPPPKRKQNIVSCKWIFKRKYDEDGQIDRYKARLVARGFSQKYGIDYRETFAPVVRLNTLRAVIALAVHREMQVHQMDVKTAFLNGTLQETVYMEQPPGMKVEGREDWVCKLNRSLYGLKQSPRQWNTVLDQTLKEMGFEQSIKDPCLYVGRKPLTYITIYVDDLIIAGESMEAIEAVKNQLQTKFHMSDMGRLHHVLGIKIMHGRNGQISLSQESYIRTLLKKFQLENMKIYATPSDMSVVLQKHHAGETAQPVNATLYKSMVGSLMYCSLGSRPDIQYAVNVAARYCSNPNQHHLTAVKRIFGYLKGAIDYQLTYQPGKEPLCGYTDSDFARDRDDRKSTTGYFFKLSGAATSWYSGKQKTVSVSTANAEYLALGAAAREGLFLQQLHEEMGTQFKPIEIYEDNQAAIAIAKNPVHYSKQKHIDVQHHFIREEVNNGHIKVTYCPTNQMTADILTKPLPRSQFETFRQSLGLHTV